MDLPLSAARFPRTAPPALVLAALLVALSPASAAEDWKFDVVHLKTGRTLQGLIIEESPAEIVFKYVSRKPGAVTTVNRDIIQRREIDRLELLDPEERKLLATRISRLASERSLDEYLKQLLEPG